MTTPDTPVGGDRDAVAEAEVAYFMRDAKGWPDDAVGYMSIRAVRALLARAEAAEARVKELEAALAHVARVTEGSVAATLVEVNGVARRALPPAPEVPRA